MKQCMDSQNLHRRLKKPRSTMPVPYSSLSVQPSSSAGTQKKRNCEFHRCAFFSSVLKLQLVGDNSADYVEFSSYVEH